MSRLVAAWIVCILLDGDVSVVAVNADQERPVYHSPLQVAYSKDGHYLAVGDVTSRSLVLIDSIRNRIARCFPLNGRPAGIAWSSDGSCLYVAESSGRRVTRVEMAGLTQTHFNVDPNPYGIALLPKTQQILVTHSSLNRVSLLNADGVRQRHWSTGGRVPGFIAVTPDQTMAVVANREPAGAATDTMASAAIALIDLADKVSVTSIRLPPNSVNVFGIAVSPDGHWAYAVHNLARAMLPTEQIEYGWINANALSIIDLVHRRLYATILLDRFNRGAANPFGAAVAADGATLWITLSGTHEIGRVNLRRLHSLLKQRWGVAGPPMDNPEVVAADAGTARGSMDYSDTWQIGIQDPTSVEVLQRNLPAEYGQGQYLARIFIRKAVPGKGPRGLAISPDGKRVAVAMYYSGDIALVDSTDTRVTGTVSLGPQPPMDAARRGEMIFHDATYCFQQWLSCSTCHPDGRADGLNWDLMNDGIGNPKNTRSLVLSDRTPPAMSHGVRAGMPEAVVAGFKYLLSQEPKPNELRAVEAYLGSLAPEHGPVSTDERWRDSIRRGRAIFESPRVGCSRCHPAPLYTDLRMHDVGTQARPGESSLFDTPALVELWRTAPYLHDGRAATLRDIFDARNSRNRHGRISHLSEDELNALIHFLKSL